MKITVKMSDETVVICSKCHWSGAIEDAHWMQETEYGYCPKCGSYEFDDLESWEREQVDYGDFWDKNVNDNNTWEWEWTWIGWKARVTIYALLASGIIFILLPWGVGAYHIVDWIF